MIYRKEIKYVLTSVKKRKRLKTIPDEEPKRLEKNNKNNLKRRKPKKFKKIFYRVNQVLIKIKLDIQSSIIVIIVLNKTFTFSFHVSTVLYYSKSRLCILINIYQQMQEEK